MLEVFRISIQTPDPDHSLLGGGMWSLTALVLMLTVLLLLLLLLLLSHQAYQLKQHQ